MNTLRTILYTFLVLAFAVPELSADDWDSSSLIARGDEYYRLFDNRSAYEYYLKAYELTPTDFESLVRMVRIHNDIGRSLLWQSDSAETWYLQAAGFAEELVKQYPDRAESHFWLALARGSLVPFRGVREKLDIGKFVVRHARRAVELDSTFAPAYVILGILYREAARLKWYERLVANVVFGGSLPGTIEDSEEALKKAAELKPDDLFAHFELARTYGFQEKNEEAVESLQKALALRPRSERERDTQRRAERYLNGGGK